VALGFDQAHQRILGFQSGDLGIGQAGHGVGSPGKPVNDLLGFYLHTFTGIIKSPDQIPDSMGISLLWWFAMSFPARLVQIRKAQGLTQQVLPKPPRYTSTRYDAMKQGPLNLPSKGW